jgi:hypothetical protein
MKFWFVPYVFLWINTLAANAFANLPESSQWQFKVLLDNREIGTHHFTVSEANGRQTIQTDASFDVNVFFVNLYRYRHQSTEVWQGNCLRSIDSETDANGKPFLVEGNLVAGQSNDNYFRVNTAGTETELPPCVMTFAYWNPIFLDEEKLLNSQTGIYEDVTITRLGEESFQFNGKAVDSIKYHIDLKAGPITLWYSANDFRWLALESLAAGGRILRYEPLTITSNSSGPASAADSVVSQIISQ